MRLVRMAPLAAALALGACQAPPPAPPPVATGRPALWANTGLDAHDAGAEHCPAMSWNINAMSIGATIGLRGVIWNVDGSGISDARGAATTDGRFDMVVTRVSGDGPQGRVSGRRNQDGSLDVRMDGAGCSDLNLHLPPGARET